MDSADRLSLASLTDRQLRAARALLGWSAQQLADASKAGVATIRRVEPNDGPVNMTASTMAAVQRALEAAGVEFIAENGGGAGVRMRKAETP